MTFQQIWDQLVRKDSGLSDENARVEFRSADLKHLLRQVYEQGQKSRNHPDKLNASFNKGDGVFDTIFGRRNG